MPPTTPPRFRVTLVRHGESTWNDARRCQGQNDEAELTEAGREQAREVAIAVRDQSFERLISSDLTRTMETATIIAEVLHLEVEVDPLLRERNFGTYEGAPLAQLTSDVSGIRRGIVVDPDAAPPKGESFRDVVARAQQFLLTLGDPSTTPPCLVVTHGGMVRALRALTPPVALEGLEWYAVGNCSVWPLDTLDSGWSA